MEGRVAWSVCVCASGCVVGGDDVLRKGHWGGDGGVCLCGQAEKIYTSSTFHLPRYRCSPFPGPHPATHPCTYQKLSF